MRKIAKIPLLQNCWRNARVISFLLLSFALGTLSALLVVSMMESDNPTPVDFCFISEMAFIPEVDAGVPVSSKEDFLEQTQLVQEVWSEKQVLHRHLSPTSAQEMSRWAQDEMKMYDQVPQFSDMELVPVTTFTDGQKIVFKGIIDDNLPSHSPIVVRRLLVYVLYDAMTIALFI